MTIRGHGDGSRQHRRSTRAALRTFFGMAVALILAVSLGETAPSASSHDHSGGSVDAPFFQDEHNIIGTSFRPDVQNMDGLAAVNCRSEPYKHREEIGYIARTDTQTPFSSAKSNALAAAACSAR